MCWFLPTTFFAFGILVLHLFLQLLSFAIFRAFRCEIELVSLSVSIPAMFNHLISSEAEMGAMIIVANVDFVSIVDAVVVAA